MTEETVEYNSLRWVKKELDLILQEAQASLSAYIEDSQETDRLRESIEHLHMVQGTLQMVELYGAAQLAEEMEKVSETLLNGKIEKVEDAYDVLMRSMLQLPDYLESLQSGNKDVPMVLLPLLNDLRASRNASLLSENVLFFPDVEVQSDDSDIEVATGELISTARKLRPHYQVGLLGFFKGEKVAASLKRILAVLGELEKKSAKAATRRVWSITAALIEGLSNDAIDANISIKMLLGQVDRTIKQLIDSDEDSFAKQTPSDLLKNLLYYVARVTTDTPRVKKVKETYRLEELLPADADLEGVRSGMGGLNAELLSTVSSGIREDLLEVKDSLEIFVHSEVQDVSRLSNLPDLLGKIADTLSMLGLGMAREQVMEQQAIINRIIAGEQQASDELIMDIAGVLLSVESQLNSFIANRSSGEAAAAVEGMPQAEYQEVMSAVVREVLQDFTEARQAILSYLENPADRSVLEVIVNKLEQVDGAMFMLPVQKLKPQVDAVRRYIRTVMLNAGVVPDSNAQNDIADAVTSIEYYLESLGEGRPDLELSMSSGDAAAGRLNERADSQGVETGLEQEIEAPEMPAAEAAVEAEPVQPVVEEPVKQAVSKEPATVSSSEERYEILGDDADEEILEIFIEEALEELASLNEQFPLWANDHNNEDALITIRRSFHTLKGSGRLIGAQLIGEFAWNFENMLNRVIDKSRPLTQEIFDILDEALAVLPQLIEQLKGNREPIPHIYELIDRADALGKWKKPEEAEKTKAGDVGKEEAVKETAPVEPTPDVVAPVEEMPDEETVLDISEFEEPVLDEPELFEAGQQEAVSELSLSDLSFDEPGVNESVEDLSLEVSEDELLLDEDTLPSADTVPESTEAHEEDFDIDLTDELEALQVTGLEEESTESEAEEIDFLTEVPEIEFEDEDEGVEELQIYIDPVLFKIFKSESESHLQEVRALLEKHHSGEAVLTASADLLRALHTLFGSARTAEVDEMAELCGGLEKYVKLYLDRDDQSISGAGVQLIEQVMNKVADMLVDLENRNQRLQPALDLQQRINELIRQVTAENEGGVQIEESPVTIEEELSFEPEAIEIEESLELEVEPEEELQLQPVPEPQAEPEVDISIEEPVEEHAETLVSYSDVDDELVDIFLEEAEELLDSCENSLQRWNADNSDKESVQDLQRHLHTLKGGARMADLKPVGDLTHALESLIISVNDGHVSFSKEMSHVLHDSLDLLSDMLAKVKVRDPLSTADGLISHIDALRQGRKPAVAAQPSTSQAEEEEEPEPAVADEFEIELTEETGEVEDFGFEIPQDEMLSAESVEISDFQPQAEKEEINLEFEELAAEPVKPEKILSQEKAAGQEDITGTKLVLDKVEDRGETPKPKDTIANEQVRVRSDLLNELVNHAGEVSVYHARMGQQITDFSFNLTEMEHTVVRLREQLRKLSIETEAQILSRYEKESDQYDKDFDPLEMDRFSTMQQISRSLQETVGDIESIKDILSEDVRDAETLLLQESRVSTELQEGLMRTRMVHFGGLASRLRRIVRQTSRELDKDVELDITGETSEVDRTVLDRIVAPLEHMLRNAVSHGIEMPADRAAAGKSETGRLQIIVDREGGDVVILVKDDGRGIDVNAVRKKATEQGLLSPDAKLSDHDMLQYIMQPGFSTAEKVTQISGRGVGMDVVDSEIKQLGGVLEIDTVQGKGTTFTIRLPLTLAINHALLVSVAEDIYAIPLNSIEGVVRLSGIELQQFYDSGESEYEFAGSRYELKHLGNVLTGIQPDYSNAGQLFPVLLARVGDQSVALHVDDLLGRREIVVKPVGAQFGTVRGISGATILGDGRVVIILEMNALVLGDSLFHVGKEEEEVAPRVAEVPVEELEREKLVMVVDDSITIRKVTERMLARHNMKVVTAKDGVDAVSQLQEIKPDVMLLDIEMPRMDGYEVASHVRNDERLKDLPIIMITSRSGSKHRDKAMEIGVNKYLGKPYQEDDLIQNINELIG